jgi:hypothetical protein
MTSSKVGTGSPLEIQPIISHNPLLKGGGAVLAGIKGAERFAQAEDIPFHC